MFRPFLNILSNVTASINSENAHIKCPFVLRHLFKQKVIIYLFPLVLSM